MTDHDMISEAESRLAFEKRFPGLKLAPRIGGWMNEGQKSQRPVNITGSGESYMHLHAKRTLIGWLREMAEATGQDNNTNEKFPGWPTWCVNRGPPNWGVWEEYPIAEGYGLNTVWDECGWAWQIDAKAPIKNGLPETHFRQGEPGDIGFGLVHMPELALMERTRCPTFLEVSDNLGLQPDVIFDVAVQHKGALIHAYEVVHKHDITPKKQAKLDRLCKGNVTVFRVPAAWIMGQIGRPEKFVGEVIV